MGSLCIVLWGPIKPLDLCSTISVVHWPVRLGVLTPNDEHILEQFCSVWTSKVILMRVFGVCV